MEKQTYTPYFRPWSMAIVFTFTLLSIFGSRLTAQEMHFYNGTSTTYSFDLYNLETEDYFSFTVGPGHTNLGAIPSGWYTFYMPHIPGVLSGSILFYANCALVPAHEMEHIVWNDRMTGPEIPLYDPCPNTFILNSTPSLAPPPPPPSAHFDLKIFNGTQQTIEVTLESEAFVDGVPYKTDALAPGLNTIEAMEEGPLRMVMPHLGDVASGSTKIVWGCSELNLASDITVRPWALWVDKLIEEGECAHHIAFMPVEGTPFSLSFRNDTQALIGLRLVGRQGQQYEFSVPPGTHSLGTVDDGEYEIYLSGGSALATGALVLALEGNPVPAPSWVPDAYGLKLPWRFLNAAYDGPHLVLEPVEGYGQASIVPDTDRNFVLATTYREPGGKKSAGTPAGKIFRQVSYFDGLGRPLQTVQWQASPTKKDIVQHIEYDSLGRETYRYLPYVSGENSGGYKPGGSADVTDFYTRTTGSDIAGVIRTPQPYAVTVYENSPLNRVQQQGAPGEAWQPVANRSTVTPTSPSGHTVATDYGTNVATGTDAVKFWAMTANGAQSTTNYAAGRLYNTVVKDENWTDGKTGTVEEYTDFEGRVVLKRIWESESKKLETYYVYDDFGDLRYVIPSAVTAGSFTESSQHFTDYIYGYKYDERRRLKEKKVPGKGWEYIVYNRSDLPILTQDAVQRAANKWSYMKYDAIGRVTQTGIYTASHTSQSATQTAADNHASSTSKHWEQRTGTANYTNQSFPVVGLDTLTINYYDDYSFSGAATTNLQPAGIANRKSRLTKTLLTGTMVWHDDRSDSLLTIHYYDDRRRLIQTAAENQFNGGTDYVTNTYNFVGELLTNKREHRASATGETTTILTTNEYDHVGRLVETKKKVNSQAEILQGRLEYNGIGQLMRKRLHSENGGTNFIDTVGYAYNERGWITRIGSPNFTEVLYYNDPSLGTTTRQYNGNISEQRWGHGTTSTPNRFVYGYDPLNRLKNGTSTGTVMSEVLAYDDMGNIETLTRDNGTAIAYAYSGNRLASLSGGLTGSYTYDANGNALTDRTGMAFTYSHLNLPKTANRTGANAANVTYIYDALGTKLRKTATVSGTTTQREYIAGIEYSKVGSGASAIEMVHTEEGYLQRNSNNTYTYHYNLTDHLGNVRATLQRTTATTGTVIQKHDYYPFGKSKAILTGGINRYLYNGKEVQGELGNQLDYGARFYDAEIGRWNVVDPLAELYSSWSPYNYAVNNPTLFIDPTGKWITILGSDGTIYRYENGQMQKQNDEGDWVNAGYYFGGDNYVTNIYSNLLAIEGGDKNSFGSKYLALFNNDETNVAIVQNSQQNRGAYGLTTNEAGKNLHFSGTIFTDDTQRVNTISNGRSEPFHTTLFHEIAHGYSFSARHNFFGRSDTWLEAGESAFSRPISNDEVYAVTIENFLRAEQRLDIRTHYNPDVGTSRIFQKTGKTAGGNIIYTPTSVADGILKNIYRINLGR